MTQLFDSLSSYLASPLELSAHKRLELVVKLLNIQIFIQVYKWPITHQKIYHKFPGIGVYHVRINCTNRLYATTASTISIVQVPVIGKIL